MGWSMMSKSKQRSYMSLLITLIILVDASEVEAARNNCKEEERMGLLEIKHSLGLFAGAGAAAVDHILPTWDVDDHTRCCEWERVECSPTTGHVTGLSLSDITEIDYIDNNKKIWPLNLSIFLHFPELQSLDLSSDSLDNGIENTGLGRLSSLRKLEILDLSGNYINNNSIFHSLGKLTSLKVLLIGDNSFEGYFPAHELAPLKKLETLDLVSNSFNGSSLMQGLNKLENLNLSYNRFTKSILSSLIALPSLKVLNLWANDISGPFPPEDLTKLKRPEKLELTGVNGISTLQDCKSLSRLNRLEYIWLLLNNINESIISCLSALPSLKILNLRAYGIGSLTFNDCKSFSRLNRLEYIGFSGSYFNESIISCLSALPSLKILDLSGTHWLGDSFAAQDLSELRTLEVLNLSDTGITSLTFNDSKRQGKLSNLLYLDLSHNYLNKDVLRSLDALPSLKFLSLQYQRYSMEGRNSMEGVITDEEMPNLPALEVLLLNDNQLNGTIPMQGLTSFRHLERLDLSKNNFIGNIPSTIQVLSSLKELSLAHNQLNGSLPDPGFCELTNLQVLDLSQNLFQGNLPLCFTKLTSLRLVDLSWNKFTGSLQSSMISSLTSLEYIDISHNKFVGSFSFRSFSNHTKLEVVEFISDDNNFEVETEEGLHWLPLFQLKVLVLSNCNLNSRLYHKSIPSFLLHQFKLRILDLSHNSLEGELPNWLLENNTKIEVFKLRNNSLGGILRMPRYRNVNIWWLDISDNNVSGSIPADIGQMLPYISHFNLSGNYFEGRIPLAVGDLTELAVLDLSNNNLSGEVPKGLFTHTPDVLKLSHNRLQGQVLSGNITSFETLLLDNNQFTGEFAGEFTIPIWLKMLDIGNNLFSGMIPSWLTNMSSLTALVIRNNRFEGEFPCGRAPFEFLDISQNSFSGSLPACPNLQSMKHLHLESNMFTGTIPQSFGNLSSLLTFDISSNELSGRIPSFIGELTNLRILLMRKNKFLGSIPDQICRLSNVSLIDLSNNYLSGAIPHCLQNITGPTRLAFMQKVTWFDFRGSLYEYKSENFMIHDFDDTYQMQDEAHFITKSRPDTYKGSILDYMSGLDFSCNNLTGEIPRELGLLTHIRALNLSHNRLTGQIPRQLSNLAKIESLDLSWNGLSGRIPTELTVLNTLEVFTVAHNNLSGRLPEMKGQFATFTQDSYEGNPLLCGKPLEKSCIPGGTSSSSPTPSDEGQDKWYEVDMVSFVATFTVTMFMFLFGFVIILYVNPYWRRRWFNFIDSCYYFLYDFLYNLPQLLSAVLRRNE